MTFTQLTISNEFEKFKLTPLDIVVMYMSEACVTSPNAKARLRKLILADLLKNKIKPGSCIKLMKIAVIGTGYVKKLKN